MLRIILSPGFGSILDIYEYTYMMVTQNMFTEIGIIREKKNLICDCSKSNQISELPSNV